MSVIKDFELGGGFPAHNKYKLYIYYYADISHSELLNDTCDTLHS